MKKVLIFGSGTTGQRLCDELANEVEIIGFLDNDKTRCSMVIKGVPVLGDASATKDLDFDEIIIGSMGGYDIMQKQLLEVGVNASKIRANYVETQVKARLNFLHDYANLYRDKLNDSLVVAEGGVFQGEFAKEINKAFPEQKLYLFDTFEGFDQRDVDKEQTVAMEGLNTNNFNDTSVNLVMSKMTTSENVVIRKGFFPDTAKGLENLKYFFVNLDFDLYAPILEGLRYFVPKIAVGGVLLIHDYFNQGFPGVKKAVEDYEAEQNIQLVKIPIGDHCSIGILKTK